MDVVFRDKRRMIIRHDHEDLSTLATRVTINFRDQKNGEKDEKRSQKRSTKRLCAVRTWVRIVQRVRRKVWNSSPSTPVCTISATDSGNRNEITIETMTDLMRRFCAMQSTVKSYGFEPHELGARSIRTGAAMALFMQDKDPTRTRILGRWKSYAFLEYIRPQVLELTDDLAEAMAALTPITDLADGHPGSTPEAIQRHRQARVFGYY